MPRPMQKSSKLKQVQAVGCTAIVSNILDISTFSLNDEHVLSSISYSLKAAQASSKYKSHATTPLSPSKPKNLANKLMTSWHNHNTQYSVYLSPTYPKFGTQTANRQN